MSYLVTLSNVPTEQPEWFREKYRALAIKYDIFYGRTNDGTPWIWRWNDEYEYKVRLRNGRINIDFESEEKYTWFILKEL